MTCRDSLGAEVHREVSVVFHTPMVATGLLLADVISHTIRRRNTPCAADSAVVAGFHCPLTVFRGSFIAC
jgi:hypothetical protein